MASIVPSSRTVPSLFPVASGIERTVKGKRPRDDAGDTSQSGIAGRDKKAKLDEIAQLLLTMRRESASKKISASVSSKPTAPSARAEPLKGKSVSKQMPKPKSELAETKESLFQMAAIVEAQAQVINAFQDKSAKTSEMLASQRGVIKDLNIKVDKLSKDKARLVKALDTETSEKIYYKKAAGLVVDVYKTSQYELQQSQVAVGEMTQRIRLLQRECAAIKESR